MVPRVQAEITPRINHVEDCVCQWRALTVGWLGWMGAQSYEARPQQIVLTVDRSLGCTGCARGVGNRGGRMGVDI